MPDVSTLSLAAQEVHRLDPDRFVTALFAPEDRREDLFALYAFNAEVARIRELVTEPMLGQMRLQWWREALDRIYSGRAQAETHPVAQALGQAIIGRQLRRDLFEALLDARERDMDPAMAPDHATFQAYVTATGGGLARLAAAVVGQIEGHSDTLLDRAAEQVGQAYSIIGLIRALPFHCRQHRLYLPMDRLAAHGVDPHDLMHGQAGEGLPNVIAELCTEVDEKLTAGQTILSRPRRDEIAALLPAVLARGYVKRLRKVSFNPFDPRMSLPGRRPLALMASAIFRRF